MRKMSSRNSLLTHLLPAPVRCREIHFQYNLNPVRCQRTTVSGRTRTNAHFHPYQSRRNITQNNLSEIANRGCGCLPFQNSELLPESQIFQEQLAARAKEPDSQNREKPQQTEHEPVSHGDWQRKARNSSD
jgi:hypothetical protein